MSSSTAATSDFSTIFSPYICRGPQLRAPFLLYSWVILSCTKRPIRSKSATSVSMRVGS